jgi:hypothetical protein
MAKRIALIKNGIVFNIIVGSSEEEMALLFECDAKEITIESGHPSIGYGYANGVFEQPPYIEPEPQITE